MKPPCFLQNSINFLFMRRALVKHFLRILLEKIGNYDIFFRLNIRHAGYFSVFCANMYIIIT